MSTNEQYTKYIDKDKILPELRKMSSFAENEAEHEAIELIITKIEMGYFDWNRGSE
jgi:hypothetical protein